MSNMQDATLDSTWKNETIVTVESPEACDLAEKGFMQGNVANKDELAKMTLDNSTNHSNEKLPVAKQINYKPQLFCESQVVTVQLGNEQDSVQPNNHVKDSVRIINIKSEICSELNRTEQEIPQKRTKEQLKLKEMEGHSSIGKVEDLVSEVTKDVEKFETNDASIQESVKPDSNCSVKVDKGVSLEYKISPFKLDEDELLIPKVSGNFQTNSLAIITAALVANDAIFEGRAAQTVMSLYFGMFNIYLEFTDIPIIKRSLSKLGFKIHEVSIEEWTSWVAVRRKGSSQIVAQYLGEPEDLLLRLAWTLLGPLLCLLGHRPNKSNIHFWGKKMLKTYYVATNLPKHRCYVLFYPSLKFTKCITKILDRLCEVKRHLFFLVYNTASSVPNHSGAVCRLTVELLRGTGLLDFILIDQFLLIQNPFALLLNNLAKNASVLLRAYDKFMDYGHLAPWCAIIAAPEDLKILQNPGLKYAAAVARGLAIKKGFTILENYRPTEETEEIKDTIKKANQLAKEIKRSPITQTKKDVQEKVEPQKVSCLI